MTHAYIYAGPKNSGKMAEACSVALELTGGNKSEIIEVTNERYGEKESEAILIGTVRKMRQEVYIRPYGEKKVFIINNADTMNKNAQNAILKVLEEPPEYCVFILIVQNEKMLLETIRSRAVMRRFFKEEEEFVVESLTPLLEGLICGSSRYVYKTIEYFEKNKEEKDLLFKAVITFFRKKLLYNTDNSGKIFTRFLENVVKTQSVLRSNANYKMAITCLFLSGWEDFNGRDYRRSV